jgi:hypothetical protein
MLDAEGVLLFLFHTLSEIVFAGNFKVTLPSRLEAVGAVYVNVYVLFDAVHHTTASLKDK